MSYSDRSSVGAAGGVGGVLILVLIIGLRVGLKTLARASRNADWSTSQVDNSPSGPPVRAYDPASMTPLTPEESQQQLEWLEQKRAEQEAALAERRQLEQEQMEQARARPAEASEQQRAEQARQAEEDAASRAQREAEQQAQLEAERQARFEAFRQSREQAAADLNNPPPAPAPIEAAPPEPDAPAQDAGVQAGDGLPGFAATELAQLKPREKVLVKSEGEWHPALVLARRGQLVQVRFSSNGNIEAVSLERVRLENEPIAKPDNGLPGALRAVATGPRATNSNEPEDDSLFVAKPKKDDEQAPAATASPVATQPAAISKPKPAAVDIRTWTDDSGTFKIDAELIGFEFNLVQLRRLDGKVISLPIGKLSPADQQFVRGKYK